ncbi:Serine/threonine-protein kinase spk-1 like [Verticillium longisporum]|nr:Serine/threonine-protein kinase spk-1 like [Verticillium longisporum]
MASFLRKIPWPSRVWKPLTFSNSNFIRIPPGERVEEELFPDYKASRYYPVIIGQVLKDRYQIVGKLGFGVSSTVWLARDLEGRRHVALKLFIHSQSMGGQLDREVSIYKRFGLSTHRLSGCSYRYQGG